jgi:DivIVA domain-containing protein
MEFSPQQVRNASFKTVKKGYDPDEVDSFKESVAATIESAQSQAMAMEARARAAVAKLQEIANAPDEQESPQSVNTAAMTSADTETISRTLLLAQKTADATVADAKAEADALTTSARAEAAGILDSARSMAGKLLEEAKAEARRNAEGERVKAESEVQALLARRDFLLSDVDHLEEYIQAQRERVRDAAVALQDLAERVPGGLADMRRPLLSASGDPDSESSEASRPSPAAGADDPAAAAAGEAASATQPSDPDSEGVPPEGATDGAVGSLLGTAVASSDEVPAATENAGQALDAAGVTSADSTPTPGTPDN